MGKYDTLLKRDQTIEKASQTKDFGMTYSNTLNAAVAIWKVKQENPELKLENALVEIRDIQDFFLDRKESLREEMTLEQAEEKAKEVFPGSATLPPPPPEQGSAYPPAPSPTPPAGFPPAELCSEPQRKKLFVEFNKHHYDKANHVEIARKMLGIEKLESFNQLTKKQASFLIGTLMKG